MDIFTIQHFISLAKHKSDLTISIFLPTHRAGRETEQDPIRYKNLIKDVETRLLEQGLRKPDVESLLRNANALLTNDNFWRHNSDGLAVFIASDLFKVYRLPISFNEISVISPSFHLKPLIPFFAKDGHFYVLSISQKQCKLFEGTKYTLDEVEFEETLPNLAEAMRFDQYSKELQFHTGTSTSTGGDNAAMFHGHDPSDDEKNQLLRWFQKVDNSLSALLANESSPMILAGVEYLLPIFKEANSYSHIVENSLLGNPDELKPEEIHKKAWPFISTIFAKEEKEAEEKFFAVENKGQTSQAIDEILFAAHHGRVETLFFAIGEEIWGNYDLEKQTLAVHPDNQSGDYDLLNIATIQTILNGGTVYALEQKELPNAKNLAAVFRY